MQLEAACQWWRHPTLCEKKYHLSQWHMPSTWHTQVVLYAAGTPQEPPGHMACETPCWRASSAYCLAKGNLQPGCRPQDIPHTLNGAVQHHRSLNSMRCSRTMKCFRLPSGFHISPSWAPSVSSLGTELCLNLSSSP